MLLKICGCVLIILCTAGFGLGASLHMSKQVSQLQQFEDFINALSRELSYSLEAVDDLFLSLYSWTKFSNMEILKIYINDKDIVSLPFPKRWEEALNRAKLELSPVQIQEMASLPDILGTTDANSQTEALKILALKMKQKREEIQSKYENHSRLYHTLGIVLGMGICIMMI